jgi:hypothetical protein
MIMQCWEPQVKGWLTMTRPTGQSIWLGLLPLVLAAGVQAQPADLDAFVAAKAGALEVLHRKAERSLVGVAQDPSYREYFIATSEEHQQKLKERIDQISLETQRKFSVSEMCLINAKGHEISRIVEGEIADDLSTEEAQNIFFGPSFAQAPRSAYVSPIYISPDVQRWVIGYATPIEVEGKNRAILHYEHDLAAFQELLRQGLADDGRHLLAVTPEGWIIADSRQVIATEQRGDSTAPADYFEAFAVEGVGLEGLKQELGGRPSGHGTVVLDGAPHQVAWQTVKLWTLVGFEKDDG